MKNNKNGLDEMQKERRNSIGNQMFMLMFYALLFSCGLYGIGVRWLDYPGDVMVIITACMAIYLVRLIVSNSYLPPKAQNRKTVIALIISVLFSIALVIAAINLFSPSSQALANNNDNSAMILFIVSAVGLLIAIVAAIIKKINNKDDTDD
jgi:Kef-type K+ transport system membrane component KefB